MIKRVLCFSHPAYLSVRLNRTPIKGLYTKNAAPKRLHFFNSITHRKSLIIIKF